MDAAVLRAFLDDIKADPFDDAPRLILADWLEEHAGAEAVHDRGTLLRLQCQAARLPEHDPEAVAMRRQARELIALHETRWLGDFVGLPYVESEFVRGLLHLTLRGPDLATRVALEASPASWQWVEGLTLLAGYAGLREARTAPVLRHLTRLEVAQRHSFGEWLGLFDSEHVGRLVDLSVSDNEAGDRQVVELVGRPAAARLRRLALRFGATNPVGWRALHVAHPLAGLEALTLARCDLQGEGLRAVAGSPHLARLRELDVGYTRIPGAALAALDGAAFAARLERLVLAGNPLGVEGAAALAKIDLPGLRRLDLSGCGLDDRAVEALAGAEWLATVEALDLRDATLTESATTFLAAPLDSVQVLRLVGCGLTPDGLATLAASPHLGRLRELHLRDNLVGDAGVAALVRGHYPALRVLNLDAARLTDAAVRHLAGWPGLADLWLLSLADNALTAASVALLEGSHYLSPTTRVVL